MKFSTNKNVASGKTSMLTSVKNGICSKQFLMFALLSCVLISSTFAGSGSTEGIDALDDWGNKLLSIFSSGWVKALACVALIIEAIGMVVAGQQGGGGAIIKKFAPWIIGTIILLCASGITGYFLDGLNFDEFTMLLPTGEVVNTLA